MCASAESTGGTRDSRSGGFAVVIALLLLLLLVVLGTTLLSLSGLESNISHNDQWSEGALHAAEGGVHFAIDRLGPDPVAACQPVPPTLAVDVYDFRSGSRLASAAEPLAYLGLQREPGFSLAVGTGYNPAGYVFARYRINATGSGPRTIRREVEALTQYGPVPE
jgi:hypothetical protein